MKQKKSPVLLIVGALTVVGLLALVNATGLLTNGMGLAPDIQQPTEENLPKPKMVSSRDVDANKSSLKSALAKKNSGAGETTEEQQSQGTGIPAEPTILLPKFQRIEPQENETATSSQWYIDDSRQKAKADELNKQRTGR